MDSKRRSNIKRFTQKTIYFRILVKTGPGARFFKAPETFRARKAIFSSVICI